MHKPVWRAIKWLGRKIRKHFVAGLIISIPLGLTAFILVWAFTSIDNVLQPFINRVFGYNIPGMGFGITVVLIYLIGLFASNVGGKRLIRLGESILGKVPLIRPIYNTIKQITESFSTPRKTALLQTVLVEFPRKGIWTIGFITNEVPGESGEKQLNLFIPTSPNPTSGYLQIAREEDIIRVNLPVDQALKMVISAGKISPAEITSELIDKKKFELFKYK